MQRGERRAPRAAARAVYVRRLRQLPAGRPLGERPARARLRPRSPGRASPFTSITGITSAGAIRYAQARYSERQRAANARIGARTIYTPQLMLNGRDFRGRDALAARLAEIEPGPHREASIRLAAAPAPASPRRAGAWSAADAAAGPQAQGWLALYENRLATRRARRREPGQTPSARFRRPRHRRAAARRELHARFTLDAALEARRSRRRRVRAGRAHGRGAAGAGAAGLRAFMRPGRARFTRASGAACSAPERAARGIPSGRRGCADW